MPPAARLFDLTDVRQYAEVRERLRIGKKEAKIIAQALEKARNGKRRDQVALPKPKAGALNDTNIITGIGQTAGGGVAATAVSAIVGGTFLSKASLGIHDLDSGTTLAENHVGPVFEGGKYLPISVEGPASPTGGPLKIILTVLYQKKPGSPPVSLSVTQTVQELATALATVLQPVLSANPAPPLRIGLGAGRSKPHLDYWYDERLPSLTLRLPFVGSQRFASKVLTPLFFTKKDGAVAEILLFSMAKGGAIRANRKTMKALKRDISANGSLLTWMLPWNSKVSQDRSAQFGGSAFTAKEPMIGLFMLGVKTKTSGNHLVWTSIGGALANGPASGIQNLPDVAYTWR
jgi:hypothetical protein